MNLDGNMQQLIVLVLVALAVGGIVLALLLPLLSSSQSEARVKALVDGRRPVSTQDQAGAGGLFEGSRESRRKQVQESLRLAEAREKHRKKRITLRMLIAQAGLDISLWTFWGISAALGVLLAVATYLSGLPWYVNALSGFVGFFGLPRWLLGYVRRRRLEKFLSELPDALDVMVRGIKSGLPLSDALKTIAAEVTPPIGPEFWEVVEGQRVGITIEQGLERMYERIPLQEVNFLSIVLSIQSKTGGNLTEALSNLAKVLRDRRKMKSKIRAVSQEAKSSAAIIGSLPFLIVGGLSFLNPDYLKPLWTTSLGNMLLVFSAVWMLTGILVMRRMINFEV
jgi:tight adherence protein B